MRTQFTLELLALSNDLTLMSRLAHDATERVGFAITHADLAATYEVFALDEQLQKMFAACESRTMALLALQAPVARDLRHVVTSIQIAGELSRIGRRTETAGQYVYRAHPSAVAAPGIVDVLAPMSELAAHSVSRVGDSLATGRIKADDGAPDAMEALCARLRTTLSEADTPAEVAIDIALLGSQFQRCVDHAARIIRLIHFQTTGVAPESGSAPD
ncbi:phosphate signaling complex PhoU family protein [Nocardia camponoti]|uniref:Phosphate transport system regulatory protein PhoU n=1 Tax=Nocardia camponoti TaxID=1616106 RepID=A0A917QVM8_9NOCA|nr:PhoU domain-containing protein [Nocardia camponoti]GGK69837.1 phosphate transport system regulatory protein PhoU [Nocardia camponoti]